LEDDELAAVLLEARVVVAARAGSGDRLSCVFVEVVVEDNVGTFSDD
jgi:hypothetical protein